MFRFLPLVILCSLLTASTLIAQDGLRWPTVAAPPKPINQYPDNCILIFTMPLDECPPCASIHSEVTAMRETGWRDANFGDWRINDPHIVYVLLDDSTGPLADARRQLAEQFEIRKCPTLVRIVEGKPRVYSSRFEGYKSRWAIKEFWEEKPPAQVINSPTAFIANAIQETNPTYSWPVATPQGVFVVRKSNGPRPEGGVRGLSSAVQATTPVSKVATLPTGISNVRWEQGMRRVFKVR